MVTTNPFSRGIDKPNICFVIHDHALGVRDFFYQEFGLLLFDPADHKLQHFFQARRYPTVRDLVNVYHTLKRLCDQSQPPTLKEVQAISPLLPSARKEWPIPS